MKFKVNNKEEYVLILEDLTDLLFMIQLIHLAESTLSTIHYEEKEEVFVKGIWNKLSELRKALRLI